MKQNEIGNIKNVTYNIIYYRASEVNIFDAISGKESQDIKKNPSFP